MSRRPEFPDLTRQEEIEKEDRAAPVLISILLVGAFTSCSLIAWALWAIFW